MIKLSNGIEFEGYSLQEPHTLKEFRAKSIPADLVNVLGNPKDTPTLHPSRHKLFIGDGADKPSSPLRYPIWIDPDILDSHLLISGAIGSGKTSLTFRIIAGAISQMRSVIVSEAKAGLKGGSEGAAYTNLSKFFEQKYPDLNVYRWPRGNCWFNPLLYLELIQDRRIFFNSLKEQIISENKIDSETSAYITKALDMANSIYEFMQLFPNKSKVMTFRNLVRYLKDPNLFKEHYNLCKQELNEREDSESKSRLLSKLYVINNELERFKYFSMYEDERLIMTPYGVNLLIQQLDNVDLLQYTEPSEDLVELKIDDVLYNWSLVIVSQPLYDPASKIIGPLFWDSILSKVIELGTKPAIKNNKKRQKLLAVLDESHRLPVGQLGCSGDFLRQYNLGVVEITPAIVDEDRWNQNKHVYQTIISMTPGVPEVVEAIKERLPNYVPNAVKSRVEYQNNNPVLSIDVSRDRAHELGEDNSGVSSRSLALTGRFTALIQSFKIDDRRLVFWIDLESELMKNIELLLTDYLSSDDSSDLGYAIEYALGLRTNIPFQ